MRSKLLIGTAALLAGMAVASAQNMPQGGGQQAPAAAPEKGAPPSAQPGQRGGQAQPSQDKGAQQSQDKGKAQQGQAPAQRGQKDQTTGQGAQGQGEQGKAQRQPETKGQGESKGQTQGQTPQRDQSQQGQTQQRNQSAPQQSQGQQDQRQPSQAQGQQGQSGGAANLTTEQRTRIRETVISSGPKVSSVNFSLSVGTVVPRTVTVVAVPAIIVEVYPQYRGLLYFVVGDQIIIVDQSHKIVAVISV